MLAVSVRIQDAVRSKNYSSYAKFAESAWESTQNCTLRGQMELVYADEPIDLSEVESVSNIVKRFVTGASVLLFITQLLITIDIVF